MFVRILRFYVPATRRAEWIAAEARYHPPHGAPGLILAQTWRSLKDDDDDDDEEEVVALFRLWESKKDMDRWLASEAHQERSHKFKATWTEVGAKKLDSLDYEVEPWAFLS